MERRPSRSIAVCTFARLPDCPIARLPDCPIARLPYCPIARRSFPMPKMTGGEALIQQIKMEGIDTIFGLPGIQLDWAFDAIHAELEHFRIIHTRHEQAASYMADGYTRAS